MELGTSLQAASRKWDAGRFPKEPGRHERLPIFDGVKVKADNGYGTKVNVDLYVSLLVEKHLFVGPLPIPKISGFRDEFTGKVITNAFSIGMLDPNEVWSNWKRVRDEAEAGDEPVIKVSGLIAWET